MVAWNTAWLQPARRDVQPFPCCNPYATHELAEPQSTICQESTLLKSRKASSFGKSILLQVLDPYAPHELPESRYKIRVPTLSLRGVHPLRVWERSAALRVRTYPCSWLGLIF